MADNHIEIGEPELTAEDAVKQRLLGRIAVAAVIIVGLLGSLAMFDALYAPRAKAPPTLATVTPPTLPEVKPAEPAVPPDATAVTPPVPDSEVKPEAPPAATPEVTTAAPAEPLPPLPNERLSKPANAHKALAHPPGAMAPPPTAAELQREMQRETARAEAAKGAAGKVPQTATAPTAPTAPSRPLSQPPQPAPELAAGKAAKPAGALTSLLPPELSPKQFALQLGVFSNFANAEELRSKLEAAGIPTTVEARVRAGPFATRGEADAARAKLRALGIEESIMVSVKR